MMKPLAAPGIPGKISSPGTILYRVCALDILRNFVFVRQCLPLNHSPLILLQLVTLSQVYHSHASIDNLADSALEVAYYLSLSGH
jgi:hypothetical protein